MNILVLSNLYPPHEIGGYEIRCRDVCERLAAAGHAIHVLTSDHQIDGRATPDEPHISRNLRIHGMYGHPWLPIHKLHALEAHNHRVLRREIAARNPDVIHVWNMGGISKSLLLQLERCGIPVVYDVSDHWIARSLRADVWLSWWNRRGPAQRFLTNTGLRRLIDSGTPTAPWDTLRFERIYFCSAFMRDFTAEKRWPVSHASVIHCGIDTAAFAVKTEHDRFEKLLWVGRLSEDKDPLTAVRALALADVGLQLDLYGHGEPGYVDMLKSEIARLGLENRVSLRSASAAEMRGLYSQYDALLFTSNWGEPFALTPLEAMASGLPVITSLDGGQRELARDGGNCLVATAAEWEYHARRIGELAASRELRETIARTALAEAREQFDIGTITRQIETFLLDSVRR
ncbi:MAG: glycosyltransferase family 4 protein [Verrucomicrobiae bacterium]|nr:glycosyltransferase family 4 protein [Verrucomicrobiae bacterium]